MDIVGLHGDNQVLLKNKATGQCTAVLPKDVEDPLLKKQCKDFLAAMRKIHVPPCTSRVPEWFMRYARDKRWISRDAYILYHDNIRKRKVPAEANAWMERINIRVDEAAHHQLPKPCPRCIRSDAHECTQRIDAGELLLEWGCCGFEERIPLPEEPTYPPVMGVELRHCTPCQRPVLPVRSKKDPTMAVFLCPDCQTFVPDSADEETGRACTNPACWEAQGRKVWVPRRRSEKGNYYWRCSACNTWADDMTGSKRCTNRFCPKPGEVPRLFSVKTGRYYWRCAHCKKWIDD